MPRSLGRGSPGQIHEIAPALSSVRVADMPIVRIDLLKGRSPEDLATIADDVHRSMVETLDVGRGQLRRHAEGSLALKSMPSARAK